MNHMTMAALVMPHLSNDLIVGWPNIVALKLLYPSYVIQSNILVNKLTETIDNDLQALQKQYTDMFSDSLVSLPMKGQAMHIYLKEGPVIPK